MALVWAAAIGSVGTLILIVADTSAGRAFALGSLAAGLVPLGAFRAYAVSSVRLWRATAVAGAVAIGCAVWTVVQAPSGRPAGARVASSYAEPAAQYPRLALSNLLPEEDQLLAGFTIAPLIDPILTIDESSRLKDATREVYRDLDADPDFHALGSAMRFTYADVVGGASGPRHCYTYVPSNLDRTKPAPLLVFFHGSGGNFKGYLWILSKVADRAGMIVAAPSGGMGDWQAPECDTQLDFAIEAARKVAAVDTKRIHLAGLSNGGLAVSRVTRSQGQRFTSIIYLSPVFDATPVQSPDFSVQCRGKPVLVISGARDDRVPLAYVRENARRLAGGGARVDQQYVDGADHFLIFTHRDIVIRRLSDWCIGHR